MTHGRRTRVPIALGLLAWALAWALPGLAAPPPAGGAAPAQGKERIAVLDLEGAGTTDAERQAVTARLRVVLLKTGRFTLVERSRMQALLNEQAPDATGCISPQCALELAQHLGVSRIVAGKVAKLGPAAWQVFAVMIDVQTGRTLHTASVRFEGSLQGLLEQRIPALGAALAADPPPAAGRAEQTHGALPERVLNIGGRPDAWPPANVHR